MASAASAFPSLRGPCSLAGLVLGPQELPCPSPCSFRKNFGMGQEARGQQQAALRVIQTEHRRLGPMTFAEMAVTFLFVLLVILWFTREPGFFPGWGNLAFSNSQGER